MLRMLVAVLDVDRVAGRCGGAGKRCVAFVAFFGVCDAVGIASGPARFRGGPPGVVGKSPWLPAGSGSASGSLRVSQNKCSIKRVVDGLGMRSCGARKQRLPKSRMIDLGWMRPFQGADPGDADFFCLLSAVCNSCTRLGHVIVDLHRQQMRLV